MNITSNLQVTKANLNEFSEWNNEELQSILSLWQYRSTKVKLTAGDKDCCAGFNCSVKKGKKLRSVLNLKTQESQHMTKISKDSSQEPEKTTSLCKDD